MKFGSLASIGTVLLLACQGTYDVARTSASLDSLSIDSLRCGKEEPVNSCALYDVSIYELIANPVEYHLKRVRVLGFAHFEFEGNSLYAHREDYEHQLYRNGLGLAQPEGMPDSLQNQYVLVEGTFNARMKGHLGMWSGSLLNVTRIDVMRKMRIPPLDSIPVVDLSKPPQ